ALDNDERCLCTAHLLATPSEAGAIASNDLLHVSRRRTRANPVDESCELEPRSCKGRDSEVLNLVAQLGFVAILEALELDRDPRFERLAMKPDGVRSDVAETCVPTGPRDRTLGDRREAKLLSSRRKEGQEMGVDRDTDVRDTTTNQHREVPLHDIPLAN